MDDDVSVPRVVDGVTRRRAGQRSSRIHADGGLGVGGPCGRRRRCRRRRRRRRRGGGEAGAGRARSLREGARTAAGAVTGTAARPRRRDAALVAQPSVVRRRRRRVLLRHAGPHRRARLTVRNVAGLRPSRKKMAKKKRSDSAKKLPANNKQVSHRNDMLKT